MIGCVNFALPGDDHEARELVRRFLENNPKPTGRELAEAGLVAPHWPRPWGLEADPITQLVIDDELRRAKVSRPDNPIGIGWAGPTILTAGTQAQKDRYLWPLLSGEEVWCQLFSEPDAGSDLASLRTRAVRDGDTWVVNGSKIWTTMAHMASYGILLARTDPEAPKQQGISYFICPMKTEGVTVRPIKDMTGMESFNEVFLEDVRIPAENLVGEENQGWKLAKVTLGNERVSLSGEGAIWGRGPTVDALVEIAKQSGGVDDPVLRDRLIDLVAKDRVLQAIRLRMLSAAIAGKAPGPESSIRKALADDYGKQVMDLAKDLSGPAGMLSTGLPFSRRASDSLEDLIWPFGFLFSPALTIGGGTAEVQRNVISERVLGLPKDPDPSSDQRS
jgi:alkylation response protein AidB-like acyl-CoA dehydrogenase